ncbi:hypothetical protein [Opitutus terrae]|uniref:Uncharacterized protein n=1 Tax=Opitutus terrae (strain DSM 11246 / JCM 15787 / PB90-1) TaxID=452637 RepID=B1ZMB7_OPITP|nr:hypothetical protein [Opitutus terrae]ACB73370.1 hypothetical protein Oter_0079 [Opitutus terrae PB90-1]
MSSRNGIWTVLAVVTLGFAGVLAVQAQRSRQLHAEIALLREEAASLRTLSAENQRLRAVQPTATEWAEWRTQDAERVRCESEIAQLRARLAAKRATSHAGAPAFQPSPPMQASAWNNAGRGSPEAVLETALWAAAGGEVETLADTLLLDAEARTRAETLLASLPPAVRATYRTPERLVALLTAREVPLGSMQFIARMERGADVLLRVRLQQPDGSAITKSLVARGGPGDWRLVVPAGAISHFEAVLRGPESASPVR